MGRRNDARRKSIFIASDSEAAESTLEETPHQRRNEDRSPTFSGPGRLVKNREVKGKSRGKRIADEQESSPEIQEKAKKAKVPVAKRATRNKGKGKRVVESESEEEEEESPVHVAKKAAVKGKGKAAKADEALASFEFHCDISSNMPEARRLERLLDQIIEGEQILVERRYTGSEASYVIDAFQSAASKFMVLTEQDTIKRVAADGRAARHKSLEENPLNVERRRRAEALQQRLDELRAEEAEWETAAKRPLLEPPPVMERTVEMNGTAARLEAVLGSAREVLTTDLEKMRKSLQNAKTSLDRHGKAHTKAAKCVRESALAPFAHLEVQNPKALLRNISAF